MLLHAARCYFHDDNGLPNLEALKNIYQVVAQQLLNSREQGPPSSCLRSKMKQQPTSDKQGQPERNPTPMDPPERNPAEIEVNSIDITPKSYSWMRLTKFLSYSKKTINDPAPVSLP